MPSDDSSVSSFLISQSGGDRACHWDFHSRLGCGVGSPWACSALTVETEAPSAPCRFAATLGSSPYLSRRGLDSESRASSSFGAPRITSGLFNHPSLAVKQPDPGTPGYRTNQGQGDPARSTDHRVGDGKTHSRASTSSNFTPSLHGKPGGRALFLFVDVRDCLTRKNGLGWRAVYR